MILPLALKPGRTASRCCSTGSGKKSYSFNIYTMDNFGHRSLTYTQFGSTYGPTYAASLQNRRIKGHLVVGNRRIDRMVCTRGRHDPEWKCGLSTAAGTDTTGTRSRGIVQLRDRRSG